MTQTSISITANLAKETKNAVKFEEVLKKGVDRGAIGSIYLLKSNWDAMGQPETVKVTVAAA